MASHVGDSSSRQELYRPCHLHWDKTGEGYIDWDILGPGAKRPEVSLTTPMGTVV